MNLYYNILNFKFEIKTRKNKMMLIPNTRYLDHLVISNQHRKVIKSSCYSSSREQNKSILAAQLCENKKPKKYLKLFLIHGNPGKLIKIIAKHNNINFALVLKNTPFKDFLIHQCIKYSRKELLKELGYNCVVKQKQIEDTDSLFTQKKYWTDLFLSCTFKKKVISDLEREDLIEQTRTKRPGPNNYHKYYYVTGDKKFLDSILDPTKTLRTNNRHAKNVMVWILTKHSEVITKIISEKFKYSSIRKKIIRKALKRIERVDHFITIARHYKQATSENFLNPKIVIRLSLEQEIFINYCSNPSIMDSGNLLLLKQQIDMVYEQMNY